MKRFEHTWNDNFFLLHIQLDNDNGDLYEVKLSREYMSGEIKEELLSVKEGVKSYRFIVSRTHPKEKKILIQYPQSVILKAFIVDDRAYYPTEAFFAG